jgi:hypothetical protein
MRGDEGAASWYAIADDEVFELEAKAEPGDEECWLKKPTDEVAVAVLSGFRPGTDGSGGNLTTWDEVSTTWDEDCHMSRGLESV